MPRYGKRGHWPYDRVDEGLNETAGQCPESWEDLVEAESERQLADPPATWQEHWFDHRQLLRLYHSDEHCAIYVDPDVRWAEARWLPRFINVTWQYSKATYGDAFGFDPRIYSIHHAGRHGGGHAGYYVSPVHDYHNVSDCGLDTWREGNALARELPAHEIGHSVESANNGVHGSPAYEIWGDSKWAEFYIYDLYTALGMDREAKGVYRRFTGNTDDFPRRGARWFRDWFYPLWRDCGRAEGMKRVFRELAPLFPHPRRFPSSGGPLVPRLVLPAMAGLRAGRGHEQVLPGAGPPLPPRLRRHLHAADELGRVCPLHQRCCGRRHERPGRPRFRLAPRVGRPTGARPRAVPRHHVLKYWAVLPGRGQSRELAGCRDSPGRQTDYRPAQDVRPPGGAGKVNGVLAIGGR